MSKKHKTSYKVYPAWNYQREIEELNKKSEQGWQLTKGGCFHSKFTYNPNTCYRYQMDFQKVDDPARYIETFREQGWEYVNSTFNGWHFFRKPYDPQLSETAYEIFTDWQSLEEMNGRWVRIALLLSVLAGIMAVIDAVRLIARPQLAVLVQTATLLIEALFLMRGVFIMRNPAASRNRRGESALMVTFLVVLIVGNASGIALTEYRTYLSCQRHMGGTEELVTDNWMGFDISYPDRYYLDLKFDAEKEFVVELVDEAGEVIFTEVGIHVEKKDIPLKLKRGTYQFILKYDSEHEIEFNIN